MKARPFPDTMPEDPIDLFLEWYQEAASYHVPEYNAMTLATSDGNKPSARIVLLKSAGKNGFVFFTNYDSRKGMELDGNPNAALVFYWKELAKQIRIEGVVKKIAESESDQYFRSRPRGSRIGAWASRQSSITGDKDELLRKFADFENQFSGKEVTRPPNWGGYRVVPERMEFWIAGKNRLNNRMVYIKKNSGWVIRRLAP